MNEVIHSFIRSFKTCLSFPLLYLPISQNASLEYFFGKLPGRAFVALASRGTVAHG